MVIDGALAGCLVTLIHWLWLVCPTKEKLLLATVICQINSPSDRCPARFLTYCTEAAGWSSLSHDCWQQSCPHLLCLQVTGHDCSFLALSNWFSCFSPLLCLPFWSMLCHRMSVACLLHNTLLADCVIDSVSSNALTRPFIIPSHPH